MKLKSSCIILLSINSLSVSAEVTLDGTLGRGGTLPGPDYLIGADLGRQKGGNLFHSFQGFNLNHSESATFSGPNSVSNIISRVTGGDPSNIDGLIRSTIPNADMYFLNPYGIMFGPNAKLDVQGSFHASTADYLRLGDGGRFDVRYPNDSLLTIAPIEAFGFLTDTPAPITTQNSDLSVFDGNSLSLIGGDLHLNSNSPVIFDEKGFMAVFARSKLSASAGRINLASVASIGEVIPSEFGLDLNALGGTITANNILMDVSGRGSGSVFIRGGQLFMNDAVIQANTMADQNGKEINMKLNQSLEVSGDMQALLSKTFGSGKGGDITIVTPNLTVVGSVIDLSSFAEGNGGDVKIKTTMAEFKLGGASESNAYGKGQGGNFYIEAKDFFSLLGQREGTIVENGFEYTNFPSKISTIAYSAQGGSLSVKTNNLDISGGAISSSTLGEGDSGDLMVQANNISIKEGGFIASSGSGTGKSGNTRIIVQNTLSLAGRRSGSYITPTGVEFKDNQSSIVSFGLHGTSGDISIVARTLKIDDEALITASTVGMGENGGNIKIDSKNLLITQGGQINNSNGVILGRVFIAGQIQGGAIQIKAKHIDIIGSKDGPSTGIFSNSYTSSPGGNIEIQTESLNISNAGTISARSHGTGNAGQITVQTDTVHLSNQGEISTEAENAAGGNIIVNIPYLLYLREGEITTSVKGGKGDGGNITIENPTFVILNQGKIKAQADEGHGGEIHIKSGQFLRSNNSLISASSRLGLDGHIEINSPDQNVAEGMLTLSSDTVDTSTMTKKPCEVHSLEEYTNRSSFDSYPIAGSPTSPFDLQPSRLSFQSTKIAPTTSQKQSMTSPHPRQMALVSVCQPVQSKMQGVKRIRVIPEKPLF